MLSVGQARKLCRQRRCPSVCALLSRKKVTQKPFEPEEEKWERNPLGLAKRYLSKKCLKY